MTHARIVTLTTDFGTVDGYVGALKGVVLARCPGGSVVDITHDIPPQDIWAGTLALEMAAPWFPPGTVHVGVVDPGVGTERNVLVAEIDGRVFVGPDNGLVTALWRRAKVRAARCAERPDLYLDTVTATFHGRDVFAPLAAALASGHAHFADVGPPCEPVLLPWPAVRREGDDLVGAVLHVDRFGNAVSNIELPPDSWPDSVESVEAAGTVARPVRTYGEANTGDVVAVLGSTNRVELSVVGGNAAARLGLRPGTPVRVKGR